MNPNIRHVMPATKLPMYCHKTVLIKYLDSRHTGYNCCRHTKKFICLTHITSIISTTIPGVQLLQKQFSLVPGLHKLAKQRGSCQPAKQRSSLSLPLLLLGQFLEVKLVQRLLEACSDTISTIAGS